MINEEIPFTQEEMVYLLEEWISYVLKDIEKYGLPKPYENHPFQCVPDYVKGYFEEYFQPDRLNPEDAKSVCDSQTPIEK
jgi:hypothetical protein